uniref:Uncharacterized protein n=1 Tax=Tanacetum cinerariifolium TaxID=118510 RepID=A0A6L2KU09_TANCI|nr:hypothetical protein [Tanacetum cinerariifolium]
MRIGYGMRISHRNIHESVLGRERAPSIGYDVLPLYIESAPMYSCRGYKNTGNSSHVDFRDPISKTFNMTIINPLFDFDSEFTLNSDNPIFDIQNEDSDETKIETIMDEVQINGLQSTAQISPLFEEFSVDMTMHDLILS